MPAPGDDERDRKPGESSDAHGSEPATERQDGDSDGDGSSETRRSDGPPAETPPDSPRSADTASSADTHVPGEVDEPGTPPAESDLSRETPGPPRRRMQAQETDDEGESWMLFVRDVVTSVLAVALIGAYLFAISGVWPPMVAIESGSMEPNMNVNDLVFVMESERFQPADATGDTGIVTARTGAETGYAQFGNSGDVIVFQPNGASGQTPIIHRAMFWVEEGEDWVAMANESYLGSVDSCDRIQSCPAPHDGFITKGDNNGRYDQAGFGHSNEPVKPEWIVGTAEVRIPELGWFRLRFQE